MCHFVQFFFFFFLIWYVKGPLTKLATKIFDLSVLILGAWLHIYLKLQIIKTVSFYIRSKKCIFYCILYCTSFLSFQFSRNFRASKTKICGVAVDKPPHGSVNGSLGHSRNRAFCYRLAVLHTVFHLKFIC